MTEFNEKLTNEKYKPTKNRMNLGIELNLIDFSSLRPAIHIKESLGIEYFDATTVTSHSYPEGSVAVNRKIPIKGNYLAPTILFKKTGL